MKAQWSANVLLVDRQTAQLVLHVQQSLRLERRCEPVDHAVDRLVTVEFKLAGIGLRCRTEADARPKHERLAQALATRRRVHHNVANTPSITQRWRRPLFGR